MWESSVEVYYKDMKNQIEFKEGSLPEDNIKNNTDNNINITLNLEEKVSIKSIMKAKISFFFL